MEFTGEPLLLPATAVTSGYLLLVAASACYLGDFKEPRTARGRLVVSLYNAAMVVAYAVMGAWLWGVLGSEGLSTVDPTHTAHDPVPTRVYGYSRPVQFLETLVVMYRGDRSRLTVAHVLHNALTLPLWAVVLDNVPGQYRVVAALHATVYALYHAYYVPATYGKCAYPCAYGVTGALLGLHLSTAGLVGVMLRDGRDSSGRWVPAAAWLLYSALMFACTAPIMWKKRLNRCCPTQPDVHHVRTVGEVV
jgi:hypothetical protein